MGGLLGADSGTVNNSFWDTQVTNQSTSAGSSGSAGYEGLTTAQMQLQTNFETGSPFIVGTGWNFSTIWGINSPPAYPTLLAFDASLGRTISGTAYSDQGITPLSAGTVQLLDDGSVVTSVSLAANGTYQFSFASGAIADASDLLLYLTGISTKGNVFAVAPNGGLGISNLNIYANDILVGNGTTTAANSSLATALGGASLTGVLYTNLSANLTLASNALLQTSCTTYTVDGTIGG